MKKLILLTMLLGLTGCGGNNQSDTSQPNPQATTLQQTELTTQNVFALRLATAPQSLGAVAPLAGWNITNSKVYGASTLIDAVKDTKVSASLVSPNPKQVADVLKGGAAGIALSLAVDQLLNAVDWVLDPANNQIRYHEKDQIKPPNFPSYYMMTGGISNQQIYGATKVQLCLRINFALNALNNGFLYSFTGITGDTSGLCTFEMRLIQSGELSSGGIPYSIIQNSNYDPTKPIKNLSLDVLAEQVISNADANSQDAQVATNLAAQNILNDVIQAEPVVQDLENNADGKCPSGIINNGSCWVCSRESWMPIRGRVVYAKDVVFGLNKCSVAMNSSQLLTRYNAYSELGAARDEENACWLPQDPEHLEEAIKAKATAAECKTYLGILGQ